MRHWLPALIPLLLPALPGCGRRSPAPRPPETAECIPEGTASWYGEEHRGRPTARGEPFDPEGLTAGHRTLPMGTPVWVGNQRNGQTMDVRINDRGPMRPDRVPDLSQVATLPLGMLRDGLAPVRLTILETERQAS